MVHSYASGKVALLAHLGSIEKHHAGFPPTWRFLYKTLFEDESFLLACLCYLCELILNL